MNWKAALRILLILLALLPVSAILTFMLFPLWGWIEATFGIEAVGHAMVADWCFVATYAVLLAIFALLNILKKRKA